MDCNTCAEIVPLTENVASRMAILSPISAQIPRLSVIGDDTDVFSMAICPGIAATAVFVDAKASFHELNQ